jgi:hypothetical protein
MLRYLDPMQLPGSAAEHPYLVIAVFVVLVVPAVSVAQYGVCLIIVLQQVYEAFRIFGLLLRLLDRVRSHLMTKQQVSQQDQSLIQRLRSMSGDEKAVICEYVQQDKKSLFQHIGNGAAMGLVRKGILYQPAQIRRGMETPLNLDDDVWNYLKKHPRLLKTKS